MLTVRLTGQWSGIFATVLYSATATVTVSPFPSAMSWSPCWRRVKQLEESGVITGYQANIDRLNEQVDAASGGEATRLKRDRDNLSKKFNELRSFDDRLRHYADMRISIDLDDGVKVNYGKFGDLLADVKAITGSAPEEI